MDAILPSELDDSFLARSAQRRLTDNQKREALLSKLDLLDLTDGRKKGYER